MTSLLDGKGLTRCRLVLLSNLNESIINNKATYEYLPLLLFLTF